MIYKVTLWKELTQIIESSKCTLGEKKQLLDCWADNLNIPQTSSWSEQRIMEDAERIVVALKKDTEITGSAGLEKELTYLVEWNVCTRTEMRKLLQKYNMMKEETILDIVNDFATVSVAAKCVIKIWYKYTDEDQSYWDREDQGYLWQTIVELEDTYPISFEIDIKLDISGWIPSMEERQDVLFEEYLEMPSTIVLYEDDLLEEEDLILYPSDDEW